MPIYRLECKECNLEFEVLCAFNKRSDQECPNCGKSENKQLMPKSFSIGGPTAAKMGRFNYRAGFNLEKAKGERRDAEAGSHMGTDPYQQPGIAIDDLDMGEGVHHPFPLQDD